MCFIRFCYSLNLFKESSLRFPMKRELIFCFVLVSSFVFAYSQNIPNPGHGADGVFISVNGNKIDLQSAIDSGAFSGNYAGNGNYGSVVSGHSDNIFVKVGGVNKNLQSAIDDGSLCGSREVGSGEYSGENKNGHDARDIWVNFNGEKNLQQAINEGLFGNSRSSYSCSGGDVYWYDGCGKKEELKEDCPSSYSCSGNTCVAPCTSHASYSCYGGDVYWYDSCGVIGNMKSDCTSSQTCSGNQCVDNKRCGSFQSNRVCDQGANVLWTRWDLPSEAQCLAACEADSSVVCCHRESSGACAGRGSGTSIIYSSVTQAADCGLPSGNSCTATYQAKVYWGTKPWPPRDYGWCVVGTQQYVSHYVGGGYLYITCREQGRKNSADVCCGKDTGTCDSAVVNL